MNSINWPSMFKGNSTSVKQGNDAVLTCLHLLLSTEQGELLGDPEFGIKLKAYTFEQNNYILKDIIIDELYTKIRTFCPQLYLERKNIIITQEKNKLTAHISCKNQEDFETNTFDLVLYDTEGK